MPADKKRLDWADTARDEYLAGLGRIAADSPANAALVQSRIERSAEFLRRYRRTSKRGRGMSQLARDTGLGRESLYKALSGQGNPSFATILKVMRALGVKLHAEVAHAQPG